AGLYTSYRARTPLVDLKIDRTAAKKMGVPISEIFTTLQGGVRSLDVNHINPFGRAWKVTRHASDQDRRRVKDLEHLRVRSDRNRMVPLGTVAQVEDREGPVMVVRYNMYPAAVITGSPAPGVSSGEAITRMERVATPELDPSMRLEWTEL